jgi:hypothetical protein
MPVNQFTQAAAEQMLRENPQLIQQLQVRTNEYIPHKPTPKQRMALLLNCRELFFGGAAGGGKSDWLLFAALQYVDVPKYSAIIFRRSIEDASMPGSILARSVEWLNNTDAKLSKNRWTFPSGAVLQFGYMRAFNDKHRYQSAEFQFIGFDELTHFPQTDYEYLFSRLRKTRCPLHPTISDPNCQTCIEYAPLSNVPLRVRSASNPGGQGGAWVKRYFAIGRDQKGRKNPYNPDYPLYTGRNPNKPFIPSFLQDNPFINPDEYAESLSHLDPVTRAQLLAGDWDVSAEGRFKRSWIYPRDGAARTYSIKGDHIYLGGNAGQRPITFALSSCSVFMVVDPAASSVEGPANIYADRADSESYASVWILTPDYRLCLFKVSHEQDEIPDMIDRITTLYKLHNEDWRFTAPNSANRTFGPIEYATQGNLDFVGMELSPISQGIFASLRKKGLPMKAFFPAAKDKVTRATQAQIRMEAGMIYLPEQNEETVDMLEDVEGSLFTWTGHPHEQDDFIDTLAYAAIYVNGKATNTESPHTRALRAKVAMGGRFK